MMWNSAYNKTAKDGKLSLPDKVVGGHAMSCVGWTKDKLWVRNSWSKGWGNNGYFYIPFDEFSKHNIWDAWILTDMEKPEATVGWTAEKYLKSTDSKFSTGEIVTPTTKLNLREGPTTASSKITTLKPGQKLEVIEGNIEANGYRWWKILVK